MRPNSDDLMELLDAAMSADQVRIRMVGARIAKSIEPEDPGNAKLIRTMLRKRGLPLKASGLGESLPTDSRSRLPLVEEQPWPETPMFMSDVERSCFEAFTTDITNVELLEKHGIATRLAMLICGAPGTGKSHLAGHIAAFLGRQLFVVRLDSVISSLLGDTAKNVRTIFDFVSSRDGVLFLDELDAIAKIRNDRHELGELKRTVNTVLQGIDSLGHRSILIGATNHPELLDPAIWRRFPYKINTQLPSLEMREALWRHFLYEDAEDFGISSLLAAASDGLTGADIRDIAFASRRNAALGMKQIDAGTTAWAAVSTTAGRPSMPDRRGLSVDQKRALAKKLVFDASISQADVARLLNTTRQSISSYLKSDSHGTKEEIAPAA